MTTSAAECPPLLRPQPGPTTLKQTRWGGTRLAALRGAGPDAGAIGESWEFSTLPGSMSQAQGQPLQALLGEPLPFLAKLIDTAKPLSIQVHPQDDVATGRLGKEEAWVILDAAPGASLLAGVADGVDDEALHAAMLHAIENPQHDSTLISALRRIEVQRGMVVVVPAGTVHAIGPGILLAEIQQPVDCTYRLFDYGSGRPIHPEQAHAAWRVEATAEVWRPGQPARALTGQHVDLRTHGPGVHIVSADATPRLLIAVAHDEGAKVTARVGTSANAGSPCTAMMVHGDLLLHVRGELEVEVQRGAQLVTGVVRTP